MSNAGQMIREIEIFILKQMNPEPKTLQAIDIVKYLYNNRAQSNIKSLKEKTGMCYKQLERSFRRYVGIRPKHFINIIKFNYAAKLMYERPQKSLTQIALESGYYDQSHFIKTFRQFSGQCPKNYFTKSPLRILRNQVITNRLFVSQ
jgi:AraC-like DNA-binding protein